MSGSDVALGGYEGKDAAAPYVRKLPQELPISFPVGLGGRVFTGVVGFGHRISRVGEGRYYSSLLMENVFVSCQEILGGSELRKWTEDCS